ncbi:hypothetical protein [Bacteroides timonensis]|uniref:hypothetical protein n=1 Tax=Bacteroides timonensis TaxID=1470345 RepID=UPI0004BB9295|nr:hypothetical protein [Bacteroides timonensis]
MAKKQIVASVFNVTVAPEDGAKGERGARLRQTDWAAGKQYLSGADGELWCDVVLYRDSLYLCLRSHTSSTANNPQTSVANQLGYWERAVDWIFVATKLLLSEKIKSEDIDVDNLVAKNVEAVDASGNVTCRINGRTGEVYIKGEITAIGGSFTGEIIAQSGKIGGFSLESGMLYWKGRDYFGNDSRSVRIGVPTDANSGMIDVSFNGATTGKFGIKVIGSNSGGACIYSSRYSTESARSYPGAGSTYAAYFDGGVFVSETLTSKLCLADKFGAVVSRSADGSVSYYEGVDFNFGSMIFRKGLLVNRA